MVLTGAGPCEIPPFEVIPATRAEIDDIAALVPSPTVLMAADASEARLAEALQAKPNLIHFATHAYFAGAGGCGKAAEPGAEDRRATATIEADPLMLSGIAMAGANLVSEIGIGGEDGILTSYEIAGLDLASADLVVLSACDTGTGIQLRGQEIQGLRWGFRAAGARALVTSLWRSNDAATRRMMRTFYRSLYSG